MLENYSVNIFVGGIFCEIYISLVILIEEIISLKLYSN